MPKVRHPVSGRVIRNSHSFHSVMSLSVIEMRKNSGQSPGEVKTKSLADQNTSPQRKKRKKEK